MLGGYRGVQDYNKKYDKDYKLYLANPKLLRPTYYYTDAVASTFIGFICYANPLSLPFFAFAELHNIESKIRGVKKE
jgi:hypothetical protein